jgi:hypothetical protein
MQIVPTNKFVISAPADYQCREATRQNCGLRPSGACPKRVSWAKLIIDNVQTAATRSLVEQGDWSPVDYEHSGYAALAMRTQFCGCQGRSRCGMRRIFRGAFSGALTVLGRCDCGSWSI